jgi:xanthine dehydrogenase molybdenum-binding subunit
MNPKENYQVIGTRPTRAEAVDKVTGRALFGPDISLPGMLYGKILRSPHAHARILAVDTRRAQALDGVLAVVTARDLPQGEGAANKRVRDNLLASDKALYVGHAIAAVAARSPHLAEEAAALIDVLYEPLPPVLDVREAARPDAPLLHENLYTRSLAGHSSHPSNVASHSQDIKGDPQKGFAEAEVIVEREFSTTLVHQGYIEPHASVASWEPGDHLTVWTTTQGAFGIRDQLIAVLGLPHAQVRVIPTEVGGGFGGKNTMYVELAASLLSRKAGWPVKIVMTRAEVLTGSGPSSGGRMRVKMGAARNGRITAAEAELWYEAGAYPGSSVSGGAHCMFGGYDIPHGQTDCYDVVVNKPRVDSYRAPGATPAVFAAEQVIDELSEKLGLDPIEFRLRNVARQGTRTIDGDTHGSLGGIEVLEAARAHPHYSAPLGGPHRGRGVAMGYWGNWGATSSCTISVNGDGTANLVSGSVDLSGTRTTVAMQAAEVLGLPVEKFRSIVADTDGIGYSETSAGSRTTFATGIAAVEAARDVLQQMCARAALLWGVPLATVSYDGASFRSSQDEAQRLTFAELAAQLADTGGPVMGKGNVDAQGWGAAMALHIADVEVDPETGKVTILRYTAVQDVGKAVHPGLVEGQMQGGATQGIGWGLWEGYFYDAQGRLLNPGLLDYKMPTALDLPMIDAVIVEVPGPNHPYGVRGVGECPIVPPPGALANAIYRATGARVSHCPMTPAVILKAMGVL